MKRPEEWRWSSYNHFALGKATVAACHIQIDDVRLPLGTSGMRKAPTQDYAVCGSQGEVRVYSDTYSDGRHADESARRLNRTPQWPPSRQDAQLVLEVLRKDRKATAEFVNRHADHVYGYVRRRLIPHTEFVDDLVQEVFLAAWENLEKFRGESSLRSWLLGIARHKVEDHYRKRLREVEVPGEEEGPVPEPVDPHNVQEAIEQQQAAKKTQEVLASLPEAYFYRFALAILGKAGSQRNCSRDRANREGHRAASGPGSRTVQKEVE